MYSNEPVVSQPCVYLVREINSHFCSINLIIFSYGRGCNLDSSYRHTTSTISLNFLPYTQCESHRHQTNIIKVIVSLEFLLTISPHWFSLGAWWFGHHLSVMRSIMTLNLWTMGFTLNMEVFIHYHCCHYNFQE